MLHQVGMDGEHGIERGKFDQQCARSGPMNIFQHVLPLNPRTHTKLRMLTPAASSSRRTAADIATAPSVSP